MAIAPPANPGWIPLFWMNVQLRVLRRPPTHSSPRSYRHAPVPDTLRTLCIRWQVSRDYPIYYLHLVHPRCSVAAYTPWFGSTRVACGSACGPTRGVDGFCALPPRPSHWTTFPLPVIRLTAELPTQLVVRHRVRITPQPVVRMTLPAFTCWQAYAVRYTHTADTGCARRLTFRPVLPHCSTTTNPPTCQAPLPLCGCTVATPGSCVGRVLPRSPYLHVPVHHVLPVASL